MRDRYIELSRKLDGLIEFQGFVSPAMIQNVFGRPKLWSSLVGGAGRAAGAVSGAARGAAGAVERGGSAVRNVYSKFAAGRTGVNPGIPRPSTMGISEATGIRNVGLGGRNPLKDYFNKNLASNVKPGIPSPVGAGRAGVGSATGAPMPKWEIVPSGAKGAAAPAPEVLQGRVLPKEGGATGAVEPADQAPGKSRLSRWAGLAAGAGLGVGAGVLLNRREEQMSALLDGLIEFKHQDTDPTEKKKVKAKEIKPKAKKKPPKGDLREIWKRGSGDTKSKDLKIKSLSAAIDDIIEFRFMAAPNIPPGSRYPLPVLESSWKKWNKPSRKTLGNMLRYTAEHTGKNPTMAFRFASKMRGTFMFADPRPRNALGEFSGQQGGPDPNAMATVYKMPQAGLGVGKAAGAAVAGGALGAIGSNIGKSGYEQAAKFIKEVAAKKKLRK